MSIVQVLTGDGWLSIMTSIQQLTTFWIWPYFVALNIIGAWFIANLALVVIVTQFKATKRSGHFCTHVHPDVARFHEQQRIEAGIVKSHRFWRELVLSSVDLLKKLKRRIIRNQVHPEQSASETPIVRVSLSYCLHLIRISLSRWLSSCAIGRFPRTYSSTLMLMEAVCETHHYPLSHLTFNKAQYRLRSCAMPSKTLMRS